MSDHHCWPIGIAIPSLQNAAFNVDRGMEGVAAGNVIEADQLCELGVTLQSKPANLGAIVQLQQYFTMAAQFGRHDVEQVGVYSENGDQGISLVNIPENTKSEPVELIDAKKQETAVPGKQHFRTINPSVIKFQRLGISRTDNRAIAIDQAYILHSGPLVNLKPNGLERRRIAIQRPTPSKLIECSSSEVNCNLRAPQSDVRQFLKLPRLLPLNNRLRSKMPPGRKCDQARGDHRYLGNARPSWFHRKRALDMIIISTLGGSI